VIDSHTHLDLCGPPPAELVQDATAKGVTHIVTVGITPAASRHSLDIADELDPVYVAVGCHPNESAGFDDARLAELHALAKHHKCVAIGETGLDYYRDRAPRADQMRAFEAQIELARELRRPVVIHTRAAEDDTLQMLEELAGGVRVVLHCFSMPTRLDQCLSHEDWWISFAGNVTYPKAPELREAAKRVPARRLLVETDAPFLAPQTHRGRPNRPQYVVDTAQAVAQERGVTYEDFDEQIQASASALFGW
jgi:TatD DNase family protein